MRTDTCSHALRFDSPAIDAGHSGGLTTDQRGFARPLDNPDVANAESGDGSDIGAFETNPTLRLTGIGRTGADIHVSFSTLFGRNYRIEWAADLAGPWSALTNGVPGTGSFMPALDAGGANEPRRFYRAELLAD